MEVERVQAIASLSKLNDTIPAEYIRSENEQPAITTVKGEVLEVPVIDLAAMDEEAVVRVVAEAGMDWGLFQVVNHGIPSEVISQLQKVGKEFFELPQEERELIARPEGSKSVEGYGTKLQKEVQGGDDLVYLMKINYYPPCPRPDLALGVVAHTDMSALTILVPNEVPGLQVNRDDHWYDVKYIPNALIIHIGDQVEIMSNGAYKAVLHRTTVNKETTRMSWPVFLEPPPELEIGPLLELVNDENPPKYKTKKYKDYVYCKLNKLPQ